MSGLPEHLGSPGSPSGHVAAELRRVLGDGRGADRGADGLDGLGFPEWAETIPTAKGRKFDFNAYPYQRKIYAVLGDAARRQGVLMKSVQVGASEFGVRWALYHACSQPHSVMYLFPAEKQLTAFRNTRVRPLIPANPSLNVRLQVDNSGLMTFSSGGSLYLRAAGSKNNVVAVDADALFLDEYDLLDDENVSEVERRVAASQLGLIRRVGVPTEPGYGIAKLYEQSDQQRWHVTCMRCQKVQVLGFDENVRWEDCDGRIVNARIVCVSCEKQALDVGGGKWIARYPERPIPGFHITRLMVPGVDLDTIIEASKETLPHQRAAFFRNDLGLPYAEESAGLDRLALAAAVSAGANANGGIPLRMASMYAGPNLVTAGIDVASTRAFNVRISEHLDPVDAPRARRRALFIGTAETPQEVVGLLRRYSVNFACIDAHPEQRTAHLIADQLPGQVYLVLHTSQREPFVFHSDKKMLTVNRTFLLDLMVGEFHSQMNLLPEDLPAGFIEQMLAVRRVVSRDAFDRTLARWESHGPDDYAHAEAYDLAALWVAVYRFKERSEAQIEVSSVSEHLEHGSSRVADYSWPWVQHPLTPEGRDPIDDRHGFYDDGLT